MSKEKLENVVKLMNENYSEFLAFTQKHVLGTIWNRPGLSPRDRSLITVAALVACDHPTELVFHLAKALDNGVTKDEIKEVMFHMAVYGGWPSAVTAMMTAVDVFNERT